MIIDGSSLAWVVFIWVHGRSSYEVGSTMGARGGGMIGLCMSGDVRCGKRRGPREAR